MINTSVAYSWPAMAYVQFEYSGTVFISGVGYININQAYACGGNLIDRTTGILNFNLLFILGLMSFKKFNFSYHGGTLHSFFDFVYL